jgi:hypothetical protein
VGEEGVVPTPSHGLSSRPAHIRGELKASTLRVTISDQYICCSGNVSSVAYV